MVSPRWKKVLRDIRLHRARTALVVLAIAIGIIGAGSILNTWSFLRRVTRDGYLATNPASATLRIDGVDSLLLARVRGMPEIAAAEARRTVVAAILTQGTWRTATLFAADDLGSVRIGTISSETGAWPPTDGAITIERSSVDFSGVSLDESVSLQIGTGERVDLRISGIARDAGLAPGWMEHLVYGFVTPATLERLGIRGGFDQLQVVVREGRDDRDAVRAVAYRVKALAEAAGYQVRAVEVPVPGRHVHAAQIDSLLLTKGGFAVLTLLLSAFLVVNLISAMLTGQIREIGVMKTLGGRSAQVAGMYLGTALGLGLLASVIALPAAAVIGRWYAGFIAGMLNFDTAGFSIPRWSILTQLAVGAFLPVVAAAFPVIRGSRIPVGEALRDLGIGGAHDTPPGRLLRGVTGFGRPVLLSLRNAFRRRRRMVLTLVTLGTGGAVYLGALNLRASIQGSVAVAFEEAMRFDLSIGIAQPMAADSLEAIVRGMPGVRKAEAWSGRRAAVVREDGLLGDGFRIAGVNADGELIRYPMAAGRWLATGDVDGLVVSRQLIDDDSTLAVGRDVTLVIGGRNTRWRIVGAVQALPGTSAFATREALARLDGNARAGTVVVALEDSTEAGKGAAARRLRAELEGKGITIGSAQLMSEGRRSLEDHLLLAADFLRVMAQLMIVVGGLGLASTMSLAVLERTREIGVLRAIGARHGAILGMVQIEALVIGLASWLLAIPLSIPMSTILARSFGRIMLPVPVRYLPDLATVLQWLAVVVVASVLAALWPAVKATRVTTAAALAYE